MSVDVSVIICCHGPTAYTRRCLESLAASGMSGGVDIILVDDASPEPLLGPWPPGLTVRVIRNAANQGFVASANRGAAASSAPYLYFLNNDTRVRPGFLTQALNLMRRLPDAGFVASKLVYPDGRLQEAGSALQADGAAANLGHGASPHDYRFNHVRRVDYGSAAGLLVRREVFDALGGFSDAFAPAYYEDVDLQVRARQQGWATYYQPLSVVVHDRGGSYGQEAGSRSAMLQAAHRRVLVERHGAWLERKKDAAKKPHLYLFDTLFPSRDQNAGAVRCFELLTLLAESFQVTFIPLAAAGGAREWEALTQVGIRVAQDGGASQPVPVVRFLHEQAAEKVPWCVLARPDGAARVLRLMRAQRPATRIIYDTVDLTFQRYQTHLAQPPVDAASRLQDEQLYRRFRALETHLLQAADRVWVVTGEERSTLVRLALCPTEKVGVVPVVYAVQPTPASWSERRDLVFVGSFAHRPNVDAVRYAVAEMLPRLEASGVDGRLLVVGPESGQLAGLRHPRLEVLGYRSDLSQVFNRARVAFYPLITGAGMKGKVAHALAAGLPVVTTPLGAQGYVGAENYMRIADAPAGLVALLAEVYSNASTWQSLREAGLAYVARHLEHAPVRAVLEQEFKEPCSEQV